LELLSRERCGRQLVRMGILPIIITKGERAFWTIIATFGLAMIQMKYFPQLPLELSLLLGVIAGIIIFKVL